MISLFCDRLDVHILSNVNLYPEDLLEMVLMTINVMIFMRPVDTGSKLSI